ncbi:hypothetical protein SAMN05216376_105214 [Mameliella alba]|uniref:hypothetical protein n=1 Tax=Mameliella alba TaxID=561184 RepID=UPI0008859822|nr:hypothetical protein [Mameliella alba]OWV48264.1 hypothetical protein CDZ96_10630 [Mameliella alba]PTR40305.1 hypothetical protein LX94_01787 [Mameliella alba]GGF43947.1 hypothetical protein GCM10011319_02160 [Mameliella alba]SDC98840.1 hypothetical protein SAMN05216376_105214 [Mameliella alba]
MPKRIPRDFTADLVVPPSGAVDRITSLDAWLRLKARQQLEDGTSAAIDPQRLSRLLRLPTPVNEIDAALARALPATRAAIARHRSEGGAA